MRKFKYYQSFATKNIRLIYPEEKSVALAKSSLDSLKQLLPANLNIKDNPDLLFNSFNAAVINRINLNDDGIQTATALRIYKNFLNKFCDLEHERSSIVGFILNAGLSEFITNRVMTEAEASEIKTPFNISLGSVVWPIVDPQFSQMLIDSSDETSPRYQEISASWEVGFDEIYLALGSRDLNEAEIISDHLQIEELKGNLKSYGGTGFTKDDVPIFRVIVGDALPLGIGYTTTPAASVKGVVVVKEEEKKPESLISSILANEIITIKTEDIPKIFEAYEVANELTQEKAEQKQKEEKNLSQLKSKDVNNNSTMKINTIEDITDEALAELSAATIKKALTRQIADEIEKASEEFAKKIEAKDKELQMKASEAEQLQKDFEKTKADMETLAEQIKAAEQERLLQKAQFDFNARMNDLETKFELGEKELEVVAKKIRGLDDSSYAEWLQDFEILSSAKKKEVKKEEPAESKASIEEALEATKEEEKETPPNTPSVEKSVREEFAEAFKTEDFKIKFRK